MGREIFKERLLTGNPCLDSCNGACCRDMIFPSLSHEEFNILTSNGTSHTQQLASTNQVLDEFGERRFRPEGIVYTKVEDGFYAAVIGDCPNLQPSGECGVYEERPAACRIFEVNSERCNYIRQREGFKSLTETKGENLVKRAIIHLRNAS